MTVSYIFSPWSRPDTFWSRFVFEEGDLMKEHPEYSTYRIGYRCCFLGSVALPPPGKTETSANWRHPPPRELCR